MLFYNIADIATIIHNKAFLHTVHSYLAGSLEQGLFMVHLITGPMIYDMV